MTEAIAFLFYLVVSALLSAGLLVLVWLADRYEREPFGIVLMAAGWGMVPAVLLSCILELGVHFPLASLVGDGKVLGPFMTVAVAPVVEEAAKAVALFALVLFRRREFDDVLDGMVYGAAVGLGFSFAEDLVYFVGALGKDGLGGGVITFALRNLGFALNHSLFTALTGIGFGLARLYHRSPLAVAGFPALGLLAATGLHAAHNGLSLLELPGLLGALYLHLLAGLAMVIVVFVLWEAERKWIERRLAAEVAEGAIPAAALGALPFLRRPGTPVPRHARALRAALQHLAFHRRQVEEGWSPESVEDLEACRASIREYLRG